MRAQQNYSPTPPPPQVTWSYKASASSYFCEAKAALPCSRTESLTGWTTEKLRVGGDGADDGTFGTFDDDDDEDGGGGGGDGVGAAETEGGGVGVSAAS